MLFAMGLDPRGAPGILPIDAAGHATPAGLRATLDLAPIGLAQFDLSGKFLYVNARLCEILGCPRESLTERTFQQITFPDDLAHCLELTGRLAAGEIPGYSLEKRFVGSGGAVVWARITVSAVRQFDGTVSFFIGAAEDITAVVEATRALRNAEERLRTALGASKIGTFRFDVRRNALDWADGFEHVFGSRAQQTLDDFVAVMHPEDRDHVLAAYSRSVAEGVDFEEEFRVIWPDGSVHWLHDRAQMVAGADGKTQYILGAITDISNHKRMTDVIAGSERQLASLLEAERQARGRAERESAGRQQMLGFVAHDLRNPLQVIVSSADVLMLGSRLGEEQRTRQADAIRRHARDMVRLIDDLLDVSRIEAGIFAVRHAPVAVPLLLSEVAEAFRGMAHAGGVALEVEAAHAAEVIEGDHQRLAQALSNLLRNAIGCTAGGGRVSLGVRPAPSHVELVVSDTGRGIPQEQLSSIFDRFWQADRTSGGAGLGLAIVKGIVDSHGGDIAVESAPGGGTTFRLRLPRAADAALGPEDEVAAEDGPAISGATARQVSAAPPGSG